MINPNTINTDLNAINTDLNAINTDGSNVVAPNEIEAAGIETLPQLEEFRAALAAVIANPDDPNNSLAQTADASAVMMQGALQYAGMPTDYGYQSMVNMRNILDDAGFYGPFTVIQPRGPGEVVEGARGAPGAAVSSGYE